MALEVGFEDQSYFSKVFKNLTKMTPKQYRQNG
nr:AraC family transcriptional regulator [uncultured Intestinibacter sp.]